MEQEIKRLAEKLFPTTDYEEVSFELQSFSKEPLGFQGVHKLLLIEARERANVNSVKSSRFFVKTAVPNCNEHQLRLFNREPKFFNDTVPRFLQVCDSEPWAPKCYLAKDSLLILEDLKSQGFEIVTREYDELSLRSVLSCLARFHAASILLEDSEQKSIAQIFPGVFYENTFVNDGQLTWKWLTVGMEVVQVIAARLGFDAKRVEAAYQLAVQTIRPVASEVNVVCHSDLWRNNVMFEQDAKSCRLLDFQLAAYKCYAVDIVQALYLNSTKIRRRKWEKSLIELYQAQLNECLTRNDYRGKAITVEEVFQAVDNKRICALVSAVQILPIALLNKQFSWELFHDTESLTRHMYVSRRDLILRAMQADSDFKHRIEEATIELMEYMNDNSKIV